MPSPLEIRINVNADGMGGGIEKAKKQIADLNSTITNPRPGARQAYFDWWINRERQKHIELAKKRAEDEANIIGPNSANYAAIRVQRRLSEQRELQASKEALRDKVKARIEAAKQIAGPNSLNYAAVRLQRRLAEQQYALDAQHESKLERAANMRRYQNLRISREEREAAAVKTKELDYQNSIAERAANMRRYQNLRIHKEEREAAARAAAEEAYKRSIPGRIGSWFSGVGGQIAGMFGAYNLAIQAKEFLKSAIQTDIALQRINNTLVSSSGDAKQAASDFAFLRKEADRIGFHMIPAADAFARFNVAARASGLSAEQSRKVFSSLQEAIAVMGLDTLHASTAMLAIEQMLSKGKVMSQELRLQLGNAMPGALNIFARSIGVTNEKLYQLVEGGLLDSKEAVIRFSEELSRSFKLTDTANRTVRDINRMKSAWDDFKASFGQRVAPDVNRWLEGASSIVGTGKTGSGKDKPPSLLWNVSRGPAFGLTAFLGTLAGGGSLLEAQMALMGIDMTPAPGRKKKTATRSPMQFADDPKIEETWQKYWALRQDNDNRALDTSKRLVELRAQEAQMYAWILQNQKELGALKTAEAMKDLEDLHGERTRLETTRRGGRHLDVTANQHLSAYAGNPVLDVNRSMDRKLSILIEQGKSRGIPYRPLPRVNFGGQNA